MPFFFLVFQVVFSLPQMLMVDSRFNKEGNLLVVATADNGIKILANASGLSGIKSSQCSFLVRNKLKFPRQRVQASQKPRKSGKNEGALGATCRAEQILIANRGEIAVRVIRTAHEMGIPCVAVYSTIDKDALHVKLADESVCIGDAPSSQSYLLIPNVLSVAISHGCTMLHPGYSFFAENAVFVEMWRTWNQHH
ncbi:unnamed protein product [Lactuca virosa]|uniref:Biotin carboxylation domain-containing protein n=1 Tax=Lactuca virosa TaxID=75947 RepID=A0AAU9NRI1_9ASTR|nr:unnamed protein product [Lactuca virosa]